MLPNKLAPLGKTQGFLPRLSRYPKFGPFGSIPNVLYRSRKFTPSSLSNLAANYDVSDLTSLRNDAGAIPSNGEGIKLVSDKSGNSSVNCLVLPGSASNNASIPSSAALNPTGNIEWVFDMALADWSPGATRILAAKDDGAVQRSWIVEVLATGTIRLSSFIAGPTGQAITSSAAVSFSDYARGYVKITKNTTTGDVIFYTSTDDVTYTQLGTTQAGQVGAIASSTVAITIGDRPAASNPVIANAHGFRLLDGIGGTAVLSIDFANASKLAASFVCATGQTVTINTSGATGARISGARDLYQGTAANQPILTIAASGNYLTFDGSNDYLKAGAFALAQPETVYFVGSQVTWTLNDTWYDGDSINNRMSVYQSDTTPELRMNGGAAFLADNAGLPVATTGVVTAVYNNTASVSRVNRLAAITGTAGTHNANGFTLGAYSAGPANFANITFSEGVIYSVANSTETQNAVISYLMAKWRIA